MSTVAVPARRAPVLADLIPRRLTRDVALVGAAVALIAILGQVAVPLPFTPVPLTLGTFAVVLAGAALGPARGIAAMSIFLLAGMAGMPWFAGQMAGWHFASFGYVIGYVAAAGVAGHLARRRFDRSPLRMVAVMAASSAVVYAFGVGWLMGFAHMGAGQAIALGVLPFLIGDAVKAAAACCVLPGAWRLVGRDHGGR